MVSLYFLTGPMFDSVEILQRQMSPFRISFRIKICRIPAKFQNDYIKTELYQYSDDYTMSQEENQRKNTWLQTRKQINQLRKPLFLKILVLSIQKHPYKDLSLALGRPALLFQGLSIELLLSKSS